MTAIGRIMAAAALGCLAGCGPRLRLEDTQWIGKRAVDTVPGADPAVVSSLAKIELRIDGRNRFVLFERGIPKTGEVLVSGMGATLSVIEVAGRREQEPAKELVGNANGTLTYRDPSIEEAPIVLERKPIDD